MFSLTEHKSWNGFLGQPGSPEDTAALATILGSVYVADSVAKTGRNIAAEIRRGNDDIMQEITRSSSAITAELQTIGGDLRQMGAMLEWGLNDIISENRQMNKTLEDLLKTAKSPSQTWAFEQFDMAREAYSRGLSKEALEFINNAINGFQGQTGNRLDHRFHFLKGNILLGNKQHNDPDTVDVNAAKQCFEEAARYAVGSKDEEARLFAAEAYCHAAFAAYCLEDTESVLTLSAKASAIDPMLTEARYLEAKANSRQGKEAATFRSVRTALGLDPTYILKFSMDKDFSGSDVIDQAEQDYVDEQRKRTGKAISLYRDLKTFANVEIQEPDSLQIQDGEGALEAGVRIQNIQIACEKVIAAFRDKLLDIRNKAERVASVREQIAEDAPQGKGMPPQLLAFLGGVLGLFAGWSSGFLTALLYGFLFAIGGAVLTGLRNASVINKKSSDAVESRSESEKTSEDVEQQFQKALSFKEKIDEILGIPAATDQVHRAA